MSAVFNFTFVPWFRSVAPYIHMHRGKTFVVGIAGEAIAAGKLPNLAQDLALIQSMGVRVVLVHGFRPQVNEQLAAKGHVPASAVPHIADRLNLSRAEVHGVISYYHHFRTEPAGKVVVLGVVSTKSTDVETVDQVRRRIDEAAQFLPLEQLAVSPQCGFSSTVEGNNIAIEDQRKKLQLVVETAREVWGEN